MSLRSKDDSKTKVLLACGPVGCLLFIVVFLIEGATRPGYNPLRYPISSLSIGALGWMQIANFIITGLLLLAFAIGLQRVLKPINGMVKGPLLIKLVALGLTGAGLFSTDPVYGYPADMPLKLSQFSVHGRLHDLFSILVFVCLPIACFRFRRRFIAMGETAWAAYSAFTGFTMPVTFILAGIGFKQIPGLMEFAGVLQRLCIIIGWTWMILIALHLLKTPHENK